MDVAWIHDDITWCIRCECPVVDCYRNQANMMSRTGVHSYADFKGTSECLHSVGLDKCMDGCVYAKELFAKHSDPDSALKELMDKHCDDCMFSSLEED